MPFLLKYDTPTEVTKKAFDIIMDEHEGICAGRCEKVIKEVDGKKVVTDRYMIKVWIMRWKKDILEVIKRYPLNDEQANQ